jgi:hypothetical protein
MNIRHAGHDHPMPVYLLQPARFCRQPCFPVQQITVPFHLLWIITNMLGKIEPTIGSGTASIAAAA